MKRLLIPALLIALLAASAAPALAEAAPSPAPFTDADVAGITEGLATVGDYEALTKPDGYSWAYQGAATGETYLTMTSEGLGEATVCVALEDGTIGGKEDGQSDSLPEGLSALEARFIGARWLSADYPLPAIRGLKPGAAAKDVVSAFYSKSAGLPDYAVQDINPAVDDTWRIGENALVGGFSFEAEDGSVDYVYGWCTLTSPDEWREYRLLSYRIADDAVQNVKLTYGTDPE